MVEAIIGQDEEKLAPYALDICKIIEDVSPTPEAKVALQAALASTKAKYVPTKQLQEVIKKAGVDVDTIIEVEINNIAQTLATSGIHEHNHDSLRSLVEDSVKEIIAKDKEKLGPHATEICEIIENAAPTPEAKEALQAALAPTKAEYMQESEKLGKELDSVASTITDTFVKTKHLMKSKI